MASLHKDAATQKEQGLETQDFSNQNQDIVGIVRELEVHADMRVYELKERTMDKLGSS